MAKIYQIRNSIGQWESVQFPAYSAHFQHGEEVRIIDEAAPVVTGERFHVSYKLVENKVDTFTASFDDLTGAQLFWDTVVYLRNTYQLPLTPRPRA